MLYKVVLNFVKAQNGKKSKLFSLIFVKLHSLSAKSSLESSLVSERLKMIHEAFHVEIYIKLKPVECKIAYLLYIFNNMIVL